MPPVIRVSRLAAPLLRGVRSKSTESSVFLHESVIPTMRFQDSMPRLPIPNLDDTLKKYLQFVEPILNDSQRAATQEAVRAFQSDGTGRFLHEHLVAWDKANSHTSYISEMWYDMYLENRDALPLNLNPQLTWLDHPDPAKCEQAVRAADLVYAATRFHLTLAAGKLAPDVFHMKPHISKAPWYQWLVANAVPRKLAWYAGYAAGAYAIDMSQYKRLFASTRLPRQGKDELSTAAGPVRHVAVQRGPRFYRLEVLTAAGLPVPPGDLEAQLRAILADVPVAGASAPLVPYTGPAGAASTFTSFDYTGIAPVAWREGGALASLYRNEPAVGALTGLPRDAWAQLRATLAASSPANAAALQAVDEALFVLTLEHAAPQTHEDLSRAMLHGDGRNRWFDKCFNVVVCGNGKSGISWEHAWGDGAAVLYFFNEVYRALGATPSRTPASPAATPRVGEAQRIRFDLTSTASGRAVGEAATRAGSATDAAVAGTALRVYQSPTMTKAHVKLSGLSPDGVMQMILQLAHWRAHGYTASSYESASTAGFKHGRTEVIRPATAESVAMCAAFSAPLSQVSHAERFEALSKATARHRQTTVDALMGKGVDRHLYALHKWAARLAGQKHAALPNGVPALFTDPGYALYKDIRLSTSTLASPALAGGGFGPVSPTSYGVGYGIEERGAHFHVMNYATAGSTTDNAAFTAALESALTDFTATIQAAAPKLQGAGK